MAVLAHAVWPQRHRDTERLRRIQDNVQTQTGIEPATRPGASVSLWHNRLGDGMESSCGFPLAGLPQGSCHHRVGINPARKRGGKCAAAHHADPVTHAKHFG